MRRFEGEAKDVFEILEDKLREQRTVSISDLAKACQREDDPRWMRRVQNWFHDFTEALKESDLQAVAVNRRCCRLYAEVPVTDETEARMCTQFNGGGAKPAGIRRAIADGDLVYTAHVKTQGHLGTASVSKAIRRAREGEALDLLPAETGHIIATKAQERLQAAISLSLSPTQMRLGDESGGTSDGE
jgi:hypothetical protein